MIPLAHIQHFSICMLRKKSVGGKMGDGFVAVTTLCVMGFRNKPTSRLNELGQIFFRLIL